MDIDETQSGSFMEAFGGEPSGPMTTDEISRELDESLGRFNQPASVAIYSLSFDAEQLLAVYGALVIYLKVLSQQECPDFEMIKRVSTMLTEIKPRTVEASKSLALKAVGMKDAR